MKNYSFSMLLAGILLISASNTYAQDTSSIKSLPPVTVTSTNKTVPEKVWQNFNKYFADAQDPRWYTLNKDYLTKFMTDENLNHALFTKRGTLVYHISYGYEKSLPKNIREQVKSTYYDYNITRAVKVNEANREIWVVSLEDAKNLILVRLEEGEMEEVQRIEKS